MEHDDRGDFDISLRVFERELVGFAISSSSVKEKWIVLVVLVMLSVAGVVSALWPVIEALA